MDHARTNDSLKELEFAVFCIENVATELGVDATRVYNALEKSGLLRDYVFGCYGVLHTQGKDYIVNDICRAMERKGVVP